jgi:Domain of unknown function (DUF2019)
MKALKLQNLSNEQLAERFRDLSLEQGEAEMSNDMRTYNRRAQQVDDIGAELRRRGAEARRALVPLLDCPRDAGPLSAVAQCRYNAARELLAVEPARARATLESSRTASLSTRWPTRAVPWEYSMTARSSRPENSIFGMLRISES